MPPVQMTRQEYETKYGAKPVAVSEDFDTTPAPIRMTRAEYNATYRNGNKQSDFAGDVALTGQRQSQVLADTQTDIARVNDRATAGEISGTDRFRQRFGRILGGAAQYVAEGARGATKMVLPEKAEKFFVDYQDAMAERVNQDIQELQVSEDPRDQKLVETAQAIKTKYQTDENFRAEVDATSGIVSYVATALSAGLPKGGALVSAPDLKDLTKNLRIKPTPDVRINNQANDILKVENKYSGLRKTNEQLGTKANESRLRIAQSNVLEGTVDDTGRISTSEAVKAYKAQTIDGAEDVVRKELEKEGAKINLKELELNLKANILDSGLEGGSLYTALKGVEKQLKGLAVRADAFGDVPLYKLQDAKISEYNTIDYMKKTSAIYKKTLARTYKEAIEAKSSLPVKEINAELSKFYGDIDRLVKLDGRIVEGGKLGKYGAQVVGTGVGMAGGSVLGGGGAALGGILGGEIAQRLKGKAMASTFNRGIDGGVPESPILSQAKNGFETDLKIPSPKVGVPATITKTPEMIKVEAQIVKNVELQKKAIKDGNFTLVAELKTIYQSLVDKLKVLIADYKKNGPPLGMSIRKTVTPESVAKRIDEEDFNRLVDVIDDVALAKTDPDTKRMLSDMGLSRATDDEIVRFAKDTTDEYGIQRNQALMSDQNQATNPPTTAQNISDTVQNTVDDVNNTPTTLLEDKVVNNTKNQSMDSAILNDMTTNTNDLPKTVRVWKKSKFSNDGGYADVRVIRREDNITLYQGGKGEGRQFWTPSKKYAEQFGEVTEKTGSFYQIDNGNRMTDVYIEVPNKSGSLLEEAKKYKSAEELAPGTKLLQNNGSEMEMVGKINTPKGEMYAFRTKGQPEGSFELFTKDDISDLLSKQDNIGISNLEQTKKTESLKATEDASNTAQKQKEEMTKQKEASLVEFLDTLETGDRLNATKSLRRLVSKDGKMIKEFEAIEEFIRDGYTAIKELRQTRGTKKGQLVKSLVSQDGKVYPLDSKGASAYAEYILGL